jgi:hypothetical protein
MPHDVHYQMRLKQLTILSTFILHLQLGSTEGYYSIINVPLIYTLFDLAWCLFHMSFFSS